MCLYINGSRHNRLYSYSFGECKYKSLIADRPLLVKKRVKRDDSGIYKSPYQQTKIKFRVALSTELEKSWNSVDAGFHCYLYSAEHKNWSQRPTLCGSSIVTIFGVIPKGAEYYIGADKEVVTDQIMYFKSLNDVAVYYGITVDKLINTPSYEPTKNG